MKLFLVAIALVVFSPRILTAQLGDFFGLGPEVETIETKALHGLIKKQETADSIARSNGLAAAESDFVVVDVRTKAETDVSVIPGAITKAEFERESKRYQGKTVIAYCTVGVRSGRYAKLLASRGVDVKNYQGSILDWVKNGLPLVTLDGEATERVHTYSDRYQVPAPYQQVTQ